MSNVKDLFRFIIIDVLFFYYFNNFYIELIIKIYLLYF